MTDVLFVVEAGTAPARKPKGFTLPVPVGNRIRTVSVSYPVIEPSTDPLLSDMTVSNKPFKLERVVDVNVMARRALKDEMPGMVRGVVRAIAKGAGKLANAISGAVGKDLTGYNIAIRSDEVVHLIVIMETPQQKRFAGICR